MKDTYLSNDEIEQIDEVDVENFIEANPKLLGVEFELFKREPYIGNGAKKPQPSLNMAVGALLVCVSFVLYAMHVSL